MYCVGVMLYIMVVGAYPFWLASVNNDTIFAGFVDKPTKWAEKDLNGYSKEFKQIMISLLNYDPDNRPSLEML